MDHDYYILNKNSYKEHTLFIYKHYFMTIHLYKQYNLHIILLMLILTE